MKKVLVLGGYGLIGSEIMRYLKSLGHQVSGLGRSKVSAYKAAPDAEWIIRDISELTSPQDWTPIIQGFDAVVNCAGALQAGSHDDLRKIHTDAIGALGSASAQHTVKVVQISAAGVAPDATTEFFRTKAQGDRELLSSGADVVILRPGLVIAQQSFGGTALLRQLAAVPYVQPLAMSDALIQTVSVMDVTHAVELALSGSLKNSQSYDLVEDQPHRMKDLVAAHRKWLGFSAARMTVNAPAWALPFISRIADTLGALGWRSPLRSTAIEVLRDGVVGDPIAYRTIAGSVASLDETLSSIQIGSEHRLQARMSLLMPLGILILSIFWLLSGLIGLVQVKSAASILLETGWSTAFAYGSVVFWSMVDIGLGLAVVYRPSAKIAITSMLCVSFVYLISAIVVTPALWIDPLGPIVKIFPAILAFLLMRPLLEDR